MVVAVFCQAQPVSYTQSFSGQFYGRYQQTVLASALAITEAEYGPARLQPHPVPMTQSRQIQVVASGDADVMWTVTSDTLEQTLLPVRFPLLQGLSGERVFAIVAPRQQAFPADLTLAQLKQLTAVQGSDWPDLAIMRQNGFTVTGADWSDWYTTMYRSLSRQLVDYFPRNVIEVHRDLAQQPNRHLVIEQHHRLSYPSYEYFFVSPLRPKLQQRLELGLHRLLESGQLGHLFAAYPEHQQAMILINQPRVVHLLTNPGLSYRIAEPRWSQQPEQFRQSLKALPFPSL